MAGNKYLSQSSGDLQEVVATQTSAGAGDAGKIPALDANGQLALAMMPTGVGPDIEAIVASESIAAGAFVNIYNNSGVANVRNADASAGAGKRAHGYVLASVLSLASASVYFLGRNTSVSGLTVGARQFLSGSTPGASTGTAPNTSGYLVQSVGVAVTATDMNVEIDPQPIILA